MPITSPLILPPSTDNMNEKVYYDSTLITIITDQKNNIFLLSSKILHDNDNDDRTMNFFSSLKCLQDELEHSKTYNQIVTHWLSSLENEPLKQNICYF
ncbi:unnamed protein product [Cunninghamella echinulata]